MSYWCAITRNNVITLLWGFRKMHQVIFYRCQGSTMSMDLEVPN